MRKCKQVVSLILVLTMMFAILSVGIVQGAAADDVEIYHNPPYEPALLGDVNRDGKVNGNDVFVLKNSIAHGYSEGYLDYSTMSPSSIDFKVADCFKDEEYGLTKKIDGKDAYLLKVFLAHGQEAQDKGIGEPVYPDPTEPPTQAPATQAPATQAPATQAPATQAPATQAPATQAPATQAPPTEEPPIPTHPETLPAEPTDPVPQTALITIYGLNGQSETREFNIGDTFNVYTSLDASLTPGNGSIASVSASQTYTDSVISLSNVLTSEQLFADSSAVFPVFGDKAMGRLVNSGEVQYNASTSAIANAFRFDSDDDLMIVTTYTVTAGGTGEVKNAISMLAAADSDLTRLVNKGVVAPGTKLTVNATFDEPIAQPTDAPATQAPATQAPATQAPATQAPATQAPATQAPATQAPTQPQGKATVTVYGLDGNSETKEFNVGDTFTVYTTLNTSAYNNGGISSLNGTQFYTNSVLALKDEYDPDEGDILDLDAMFPVTKGSTVASGNWTVSEEDPTMGAIYFNASKASINNPFRFDSNDKILIKSNYTVTAPGTAEVKMDMTTLAMSDQQLTIIIDNGVVQEGMDNFRLHSSFLPPEAQPTDAPATQAPATQAPATQAPATQAPATQAPATQAPATQAPATQAPATQAPATQAPTQPQGKATVTVYGLDGNSETKEFNVGDTFTVYTTLNTSAYNNGGISSLNGTQFYTNSVLALKDEYDPDEGDILDLDAMFPVTKGSTVASGNWTVSEEDPTMGAIYFNASKASINNPFRFDSNDKILIKSNYTVTAPGTAEVKMDMTTLAMSDQQLTIMIDNGEVLLSNFRLHSSFLPPEAQPTDAPATQAPATQAPATQAPATQAPATQAPATQAPATQAPTDPPVTITDGYYLVGTISNWEAQAAYKLSENTANPGEYMIDTTLAAGDGIKVAKVENGAITTWYPDGMDNEYNVDAAHAGDVTIYFKSTYQSDWSAFGGYFYIDAGDTPTPDTITVKFTNTNNWGTVNIYCWDENANEPMGEWPGSAMTKSGNVYTAVIPADTYGIIFNDGDSKQTVDITEGIVDGAHWKLSGQMDGTAYKVAAATDEPTPDTITVKFTNTNNWGTVNIYCWDENANEPMGEWPGSAMTKSGNVYTAVIPADTYGIIFNDGDSKQTVDITEGIVDGAHWKLSGQMDGNNYKVTDDSDTPTPTAAPQPTTAPATQAPTDPPVTIADGYYLVGTISNWEAQAAYKLSENTANPGEYMIDTTLAEGDGIKVAKVENGAITTWYPDGMDNEYSVDAAHAGDVTIYFKSTYQSDWSAFGGYFYIDAGDTPTPTTAPQPTTAPVSNDVVFEPGDAGTASPAWFAWVFNGSKADQWIEGTTDASGNVTFAGAADFGGMVIVRMPAGSSSGAWEEYWNRTGDITIQKNKTLYFTSWGNDGYFNTAWK